MEQTKEVLNDYKSYDSTYTYLSGLDRNRKPNADSLRLILPQIQQNSFLREHKSRFNGFVSAGKIMTIEDDSLVLQILDFYQITIPSVQSSESGWMTYNNSLNNYLHDNIKDNTDMAYWEVLTTPKAKDLTKRLIPWEQLLGRYKIVIEQGEKIIARINEIYPPEKG